MKTHCSFGPIWLIGSILLYSLFTTFCFFAVLVRFFCILPVPVDYSCYASSLMITFIHGIKLMAGRHYHMDWRKLVFNPGVISVLIGLPLFLFHAQLPTVIAKPIEYLGNLNAPLGMLIFGAYLAHTDLKTIFREKRIYLVALLKLVVLPGVCILLYRLIGVRGVLLVACCITACVPSGNNTFMFASKFHKDVGVGSKTVALVSAFSVVTMPLMIAAAQALQ